MALRDVLVHADDTSAGWARMRLSADLAHRHGARLSVLHVRGSSNHDLKLLRGAELGLLPAEKLAEVQRNIARAEANAASRLKAATEELRDRYGLAMEWCSVEGSAPRIVSQHARYADLTIVGHSGPEDEDELNGYSFAEMMLFTVGRPLIMIPTAGTGTALGRRIAIAWNSSRQAARAVADVLPLIEKAEKITVIIANARHLELHGAPPPKMMVDHLRRHNCEVDTVFCDVEHGSVGDALQLQTHESQSDLLVAGAYGHPRIWEKLLGGVTCELLSRLTIPILLAT